MNFSFKKSLALTLTIFFLTSGVPGVYAKLPPNAKVYFNLYDHLGGVDKMVDRDGNVVCSNDYLPYGSPRRTDCMENQDAEDPYGYTGKEQDSETDLYYYGARYYDPALGRFITQDPWGGDLADPQTLNRYSYGLNSPVKYVDPTGEKATEFQLHIPKGLNYSYGTLIGTYRGIPITSAGPPPGTGSGNHPYQCVALVKSFISHQYGVKLNSLGNAVNYANQEKLNGALPKSAKGSFAVYNNTGSVIPQENDIISWKGGDYGHVGFIAEVTFNEESGAGWVYTVEQNQSSKQGLFKQQLTRSYDEEGQAEYTVASRENYRVQGWARYQDIKTTPIPYTDEKKKKEYKDPWNKSK